MTARRLRLVPRVPERVEQQHIVQLIRSIGGAVYVLGTTRRRGDYPGTMQTPGIPDLYAILPVTYESVWIEVKAEGGMLRPEQQQFRELCEKGHVAHIVGGLSTVLAWLVERSYVRDQQAPHYRLPETHV